MEKKRFEHMYQSNEDIPLILDSYDDIFSVFDPRPFSERALSTDFISECKHASVDKKGRISLKLFVPKSKKDPVDEIKIKKRLKEHFNHHLNLEKKEIAKENLVGFNWFIAGCFLIVITSIFLDGAESLSIKVLLNIAHPAGWFFLWEGMGKLLLGYREKHSNYNFYKKMNDAIISFNGK
ncbi:hypothetical protein M0R72_03610 [Candidatus Pacearchaeota archaeon]|jgi:hypothetical protein|nr:hypothetical protein [Candidatus Pacearchaeota archaeon]